MLTPSNVILFELVWLSTQFAKKDHVVGWGAFPLVNRNFEVNEGLFKVPLMIGEVNRSVNKFKDIE